MFYVNFGGDFYMCNSFLFDYWVFLILDIIVIVGYFLKILLKYTYFKCLLKINK